MLAGMGIVGVGGRGGGQGGLAGVERSGFLLRFEVPGTNVLIAGTKDGGTAAIFACSAKWEGGAPPPGGSGGPPQKMLEFLRRQGVF